MMTVTFYYTTPVKQLFKGQPGKPAPERQEMMGWQWHQLDHYANYLHLTPDR